MDVKSFVSNFLQKARNKYYEYRGWSPHYTIYSGVDDLGLSWKDPAVPYKQMKYVDRTRSSLDEPVLRTLFDAIRQTKLENPGLLEVGCSSGYLSEFIKKNGIKLRYEGCDYSAEFIKVAKQLYPKGKFKVSDALNLDYPNNSFDILLSAGVLLTVRNYKKVVEESVRVAKKYIIFYRTPILHTLPTTELTKVAYNQKMLEIAFNENEFVGLLSKLGVSVKEIYTYGHFNVKGLNDTVYLKTYLCRRQS